VSKLAPAEYTAAGLPRRKPRERLIPGSAGDPAEAEDSAAERDPDQMRDRMNSFRRGLADGRHSANGSTQPTNGREKE
jgi:hypothetical protein